MRERINLCIDAMDEDRGDEGMSACIFHSGCLGEDVLVTATTARKMKAIPLASDQHECLLNFESMEVSPQNELDIERERDGENRERRR